MDPYKNVDTLLRAFALIHKQSPVPVELAIVGAPDPRGLIIVCGRYEAIDERIYETYADDLLSLDDYVLSGGELAAMVLVDAVVRLLPGALGDEGSAEDDSFSQGLLEYPQYTRPEDFRGMKVPEILLSGDHGKIAEWRKEKSIERTKRHRPDLLE